MIATRALGQSGYRLAFRDRVLYVDPYLSDNVEKLEGPSMRRLFKVPVPVEKLTDAHWVLVTHLHIDHCDVHTLLPLASASPQCRFVCPYECAEILKAAGISPRRLVVAPETWKNLGGGLRVVAVPAAHPSIERDASGRLRFVGYVMEYEGRRLYHAGDTSVAKALVERLHALAPIDVAFLPVNERNYYRESKGIIGNMTVREAFQLAIDIGARTLVPMHWDMFAPNAVFREEIELLYRMMKPPFRMRIYPRSL